MSTVAGAQETARRTAESRVVALRREAAIARVALAAISLHYADVAFFQPEPGTSAGDHLVSGLVPIGLLAVLGALYPRLRAGARATWAISVGLFALAGGIVTSGLHALGDGPSGDDYTGVLAALAGGVLVALGAVTLWRSRKLDRKVRRYGRRALIGIAGLLIAVEVIGGATLGYYATHRPRSDVSAPNLGRGHVDVTLKTSDGLQLEGWYVPSRNRAAVLVFPGRSGGKQHHARNLIRHGYGVLLVDNRGHGASEGDPNAFGWDDETDVNAALDYLTSRADVDADRIGGLGLSVGGEILLETAAHSNRLRAVVSEGAGGRAFREDLAMPGAAKWIGAPYFVMASVSTAVFSNAMPPESLKSLVKEIPPRPVFLIHAKGESLNGVYFRSAGEPRNWDLWEVPGASHIGGIDARPVEYERRVTAFFDRALLNRS
jgi:pimeloyl-ACP methyl ester carboxylesterase